MIAYYETMSRAQLYLGYTNNVWYALPLNCTFHTGFSGTVTLKMLKVI
jgi:hypothetical protein